MIDALNRQDYALPPDMAKAITDPAAFADRQRMDDILAWIRANNPLGIAHVEGFSPFWVVSKHADVMEVSRRTDLFDSTSRPLILMTDANARRMAEINEGDPHPHRSLAAMDDPLHRQHRALFDDWFHPRAVTRLEERVRSIATEFVDAMAALAPACDFANAIAARYPLRVMMDIIGVPRDDEPQMLALSDLLYNEADADVRAVLADAELAEHQRRQFDLMGQYFAALTDDRARCPRDDLATVLAEGRVDGAPLHPADRVGHYVSFATAGHHTSSSTLAAAIWTLCERPDLLDRLQREPALLASFIEELLRRTSPAKHFMRGCIRDTVLRGREIKAGDWLYLSYPSANHDQEVFDDPFAFRLDRKINKHLTFGVGPHHCVGQSLARMELRAFLDLAVPRLRDLDFDGPPSLNKSRFVQGARELKIRFTMI